MKQILLLISILFCSPVYGQGPGQLLQIKELQIKEENQILSVSIDLEIPGKIIKSTQRLMVYPVLQFEREETVLPPIEIIGKNKAKLENRMASLRGEQQTGSQHPPLYQIVLTKNRRYPLHYSIEIPYEQWMDEKTRLFFRHQVEGCGQSYQTESTIYPAKLETQPKESFQLQPFVAFALPQLTAKERQEEGSAYLDFPTGGSTILPDYRRNPQELGRIRETIEKTWKDPDIRITRISITGYASPESNYEFNRRLSENRAQALKNYIQRMFNLPPYLFEVYPGGEDWTKLRELVEESYLPAKIQILSIIDNHEGYDRKEEQLKSMGYTYQHLLNEYFPQLRRVHYQIHYTVRDYSKGEYRSVMDKDPGKLSPYELYQLSENYEPDSAEWKEILMLSARLYPDDEISQINAAAIRLMEKDFERAKIYLDRLTNSTLPEAWNNQGVYYLHKAEYSKARELFEKAVAAGQEEAKDNLERLFENP